MARYDDLNNRSITMVGVLSALITFIVILGCQVLYFAMQQRQSERKLMQTEYRPSVEHLEKQRVSLGEYGKETIQDTPESQPTVIYQIPIEDAINAVVKERSAVNTQAPKDET